MDNFEKLLNTFGRFYCKINEQVPFSWGLEGVGLSDLRGWWARNPAIDRLGRYILENQ